MREGEDAKKGNAVGDGGEHRRAQLRRLGAGLRRQRWAATSSSTAALGLEAAAVARLDVVVSSTAIGVRLEGVACSASTSSEEAQQPKAALDPLHLLPDAGRDRVRRRRLAEVGEDDYTLHGQGERRGRGDAAGGHCGGRSRNRSGPRGGDGRSNGGLLFRRERCGGTRAHRAA